MGQLYFKLANGQSGACRDRGELSVSHANKAWVGSTGQRNGSIQDISRRPEAKRFSWPCIQPEGDLINVMLGGVNRSCLFVFLFRSAREVY